MPNSQAQQNELNSSSIEATVIPPATAITNIAVPSNTFEPCFTLTIAVKRQELSETQGGGVRIDLQYDEGAAGQAVTDVQKTVAAALRERLEQTMLRSGNDWAVADPQAIVTFDGRLTLSLPVVVATPGTPVSANSERCLITARLRGKADMRGITQDGKRVFQEASVDKIYGNVSGKNGIKGQLPLALGVIFDVPTSGFSAAQTQAYSEAQELARSLFVAVGKAHVDVTVQKIELTLYRAKHGATTGTGAP